MSITNSANDLTRRLDVIDESLRTKYMKLVESLSINELKKFNKFTYQDLIKSEISDLLPDVSEHDLEGRSLCISNMLNNEIPKIRGRKTKPQNKTQNRRRTRSRKSETEQIELHANTSNLCNENKTTSSQKTVMGHNQLSESVLEALDNTMGEADDSLNSTVTNSFLDSTYDTSEIHDDSITELKVVEQSKRPLAVTCAAEVNKTLTNKHSEDSYNYTDESTITCTESCTDKDTSESLRCNMCMQWFHTKCVSIKNIDEVGAWTCACCRLIPHKINLIETQVKTILENTSKIMQTFTTYSETMENRFANINDRITAISNQDKCAKQSSTSALSGIQKDIDSLKSDVDRKTTSILSKSQGIFDKVKTTTEMMANIHDNTSCSLSAKQISQSNKDKTKGTEKNSSATDCHQSDDEESVILIENDTTQTNQNNISTPKQSRPTKQIPKRELTFVVGSGTLRAIETRFLHENVRVKSFKTIQKCNIAYRWS